MIKQGRTAVFRPLDGGGMILNVETGDYFQLNSTGKSIWEAINDGCSREDLVSALVDQYDIEPEVAESDVDRFLEELQARALIQLDQGPEYETPTK